MIDKDTTPEQVIAALSAPSDPTDHALAILFQYGQWDGTHHLRWVIDQVVRVLTGEGYYAFVEAYVGVPDDDGEMQYEWDTGVEP